MQLEGGADVGAGMGAQHVQVELAAMVDQTLTFPLPGGSAPRAACST